MAGHQALAPEEQQAIVLAVQSVFAKLRNLYREIEPTFRAYGFTALSAGVIARDLSEKIEASIIQHCSSFSKGTGHCDLSRTDCEWEVKVCKDSGLTINQSKQIAGENYIVVNYTTDTRVTRIWVLWYAKDEFFSARRPNTNARSLLKRVAGANIEVLLDASGRDPKPAVSPPDAPSERFPSPHRMLKASLRRPRRTKAS